MSISADPKTIRALVLDLDGTILAPGAILSDRTSMAVNKCRERGLRIIIATGRAVESVERYRKALGAEGPMIYFNGAMVADMSRGEIINSILLDKEAVEFCVNLSRKTGVYFQAFFPGCGDDSRIRLIAERAEKEREMYFKNSGLRSELVDILDVLRRPEVKGCLKGMFMAEPEILDALRPKLDERFGESVYIAKTMPTFLEIMDAKVSKGQGLRLIMERCALSSEEVIAFGDEENDLPMFDAAGFSVAPSNAKDNVKAASDLVVGSNAEDGVAVFLEEFLGL